MPRDYKVFLEDILEAIGKIRSYTAKSSLQGFSKDEKTVDAVVRNLEVIGEAVKNIPDDIRLKYPDVEWHKIISLRNILIHEYPGIDLETIWDIIENKLSPLEKQVKEILRD